MYLPIPKQKSEKREFMKQYMTIGPKKKKQYMTMTTTR